MYRSPRLEHLCPPETPDVGSSVNFASSVGSGDQATEFTIEELNADRNVSNNAKNHPNRTEPLRIFDIKRRRDTGGRSSEYLQLQFTSTIRQFKSGDFLEQDK